MADHSGHTGAGASEHPGEGVVLALPDIATETKTPILDVSTGGTLSLDHLGPIIADTQYTILCYNAVNEDGSLSRITNWGELTEQEQKVTYKRIAKRNLERLQALEEAKKAAMLSPVLEGDEGEEESPTK